MLDIVALVEKSEKSNVYIFFRLYNTKTQNIYIISQIYQNKMKYMLYTLWEYAFKTIKRKNNSA